MKLYEIIRYVKNGENHIGRIAEIKEEGDKKLYRISGHTEFVAEDELIPTIKIGDKIIYRQEHRTVEAVDEEQGVFYTDKDDALQMPQKYADGGWGNNSSNWWLPYQFMNEKTETPEETTAEPMVEAICEFLDKYNFNSTTEGVSKIYNEWKTNKAKLIELLSHHPNWDADNFCITVEVSDFRETSQNMLYDKLHQLYGGCRKEGKQYNAEEVDRYYELFSLHGDKLLDEYDRDIFKKINIKAVKGERTARCLRKLFLEIGMDKYPSFEHNYAEVADSVSPMEKKLKLVFSVNPLDYLGMSHGDNWDSCHGLKNDGCYKAGTLSYMMDDVSIIAYTVPVKAKAPYYAIGKISRQMFMWNGGNTFLQSRMYPDYNKYPARVTEYRAKFLEIIKEVAGLSDFEEYTGRTNHYAVTRAGATHYPDYDYDQYKTRIWSIGTPETLTIGHVAFCPECGNPHSVTGRICCGGRTCNGGQTESNVNQYVGYECHVSGGIRVTGRINPDDGFFYSDRFIYTCDACGDVHYGEPHSIGEYSDYICDRCYQEYRDATDEEQEIYYCDGYGENKCVLWDGAPIEIGGYWYCPGYVDEYYIKCEHCGEYEYCDDTYTVTNAEGYSETICQDCYENETTRCEGCDEVFYTDDMREHEDRDGYNSLFCEDCYQAICESLEEKDEDDNAESFKSTEEKTPESTYVSPAGFKIGDTVKVIKPGDRYTSYFSWVEKNCPAPYNKRELVDGFYGTDYLYKDKTGNIVAIAPHSKDAISPILAAIEWDDKILLINETAIRKV